jgi:hypothetical protein
VLFFNPLVDQLDFVVNVKTLQKFVALLGVTAPIDHQEHHTEALEDAEMTQVAFPMLGFIKVLEHFEIKLSRLVAERLEHRLLNLGFAQLYLLRLLFGYLKTIGRLLSFFICHRDAGHGHFHGVQRFPL